jgi:indolepyruvate ferredoxin oxidoreductase, beta subunit
MNCTNILICGVGGQGLVITTSILSQVAFLEGYDIKTSDVIGLSQRGGMVFGSVRFGKIVHSALIPENQVDMLVALEKLEGLRWSNSVKENGLVVLNQSITFPNRVLIEKEQYPENIEELLEAKGLNILPIFAKDIAKRLGNKNVENTVLLGALSNYLPFSEENWIKALNNVFPEKLLKINITAFSLGRNPQ